MVKSVEWRRRWETERRLAGHVNDGAMIRPYKNGGNALNIRKRGHTDHLSTGEKDPIIDQPTVQRVSHSLTMTTIAKVKLALDQRKRESSLSEKGNFAEIAMWAHN
uniref:Uncharacterized protein n=1 Tax=Cucumis melo TaxID=3656 RepID=A0A9I9EKQ3_CUCME